MIETTSQSSYIILNLIGLCMTLVFVYLKTINNSFKTIYVFLPFLTTFLLSVFLELCKYLDNYIRIETDNNEITNKAVYQRLV